MKTYRIEIPDGANDDLVFKLLQTLENKGFIKFHSESSGDDSSENTTPATEEQVQEIIEEAELGPYYSDKEARDILNL